MNDDNCCRNTRLGIYAIGLIGSLLVMAGLVWLMRHYTEVPSPFAARSAERMQIRAEFDAANAPLVENYDWQDQTRGIVRVPLDRAKELLLQEWQDPAVGRADLIARAARAFAPLPKPPEKKNPYE
jgi:hypothetical protein